MWSSAERQRSEVGEGLTGASIVEPTGQRRAAQYGYDLEIG